MRCKSGYICREHPGSGGMLRYIYATGFSATVGRPCLNAVGSCVDRALKLVV